MRGRERLREVKTQLYRLRRLVKKLHREEAGCSLAGSSEPGITEKTDLAALELKSLVHEVTAVDLDLLTRTMIILRLIEGLCKETEMHSLALNVRFGLPRIYSDISGCLKVVDRLLSYELQADQTA